MASYKEVIESKIAQDKARFEQFKKLNCNTLASISAEDVEIGEMALQMIELGATEKEAYEFYIASERYIR